MYIYIFFSNNDLKLLKFALGKPGFSLTSTTPERERIVGEWQKE